MGFKLDSKKIVALFFIIVMLVSTITFAVLSAFNPTQQTSAEELLKKKVWNSRLAPEVHDYLLQSGYTILAYYYGKDCTECENIKNELESMTENANGQIYLQEIASEKSNENTLEVRNFFTDTQESLENPTTDDINTIVCKALSDTPFWCISGKV